MVPEVLAGTQVPGYVSRINKQWMDEIIKETTLKGEFRIESGENCHFRQWIIVLQKGGVAEACPVSLGAAVLNSGSAN
jgi:hypothetical protein